METRSDYTVTLTHATPQPPFRLLELPEELLTLLTSENPPKISFKSPLPSPAISSGSGPSVNQGTATAFVNLCTDTKTYSLRQVHSSNSIFVMKPSQLLRDNEKKYDNPDTDTAGAVTLISLCKSTLELQKTEDGFSALPYLSKILQPYDTFDIEDDSMDIDDMATTSRVSATDRHKALAAIFADVPLSANECHQAWTDLCAFIHEDKEGVPIPSQPSAAAKLAAWKKILEESVLQGIDLEKQFLVKDVWTSASDDPNEEAVAGFPKRLIEAIVRRVMEDSPPGIRNQVFSDLQWASLEKETTIAWVGSVYLEAFAPSPQYAISHTEFVEIWKDLVPERWRNEITIDLIKASHVICQSPFVLHGLTGKFE
ncbi:hypothetical protein LOZ39_001075 [Ophidiomyces ophidiicola]|nr:hypothetical protein LOZ64_002507 [Ophidiomyces ophidiicola]KAI2002144.1 hypothetical protein LOZ50_005194 [Ophidiomyces ophidiicola]KAI2009014.1 hypothetical protein LOZ49_004052 [Ophidiomyces ophidiicola]KAI2013172.1 hypothetical protein LOZ46_005829 [Ophidiomyces ophidiicola]KAI2064416.1 hypothetical protein LOZ40_004700 [Ophidiomyces ophidiicola]